MTAKLYFRCKPGFMEKVIESIISLFTSLQAKIADRIEKLPQSGSDRIYFRIYAGNETFIATYNLNKKETNTFIYFSKQFIYSKI